MTDVFAQRVFGIAAGYPDGNDADRLADDPIQKLLLDRDPVQGQALASQPTISRFENGVGPRALYRVGRALAATVIDRHRQRLRGRARRITIDLDVTDDPTHGAQQLTFFHGHYDTWCYLPLLAFLTFDDEPEQYLCAALLRPGNAATAVGARALIGRLCGLLRCAFPRARLRVRLDGGFANPALLDRLDAERVEYVVGIAENSVLAQHAAPFMIDAHAAAARTEATAHVYGDAHYAARSWTAERRIIIKAEVVRLAGREPRDNPRFVITNLRQTPRWIYEHVYVSAAKSRIGLRNCITASRSIARVAPASGPTRCACSSPPPRMCCCRNSGCRPPAPVRPRPGLDAARAAAQDRRPRRRECAPLRPASPRGVCRWRRVAPDRPALGAAV